MENLADSLLQIEPSEIVATLREGLLVLTEELQVEYASDRFLASFSVNRAETIGKPLAALGNGQWDIPGLLEPLSRIVVDDTTLEDYEVEHEFENIGRRIMRLNARKTVRSGNGSKRILLAIDDVTEQADTARELARQRQLAQGIVDTLREPLLVLDGDLRVIAASRIFYEKFAVDEAETVGAQLWELGNGQWAIPELVELLSDVIPEHKTVKDFELSHDFPSIGTRTIVLNACKICREGNNTKTLLLAMEDVTERRQLEADRAAALLQSERLLEEINHRIMNSLSMIAAVISLERNNLSDDECREAFDRMRNRISSVGALYRRLSASDTVETVDAGEYLRGIIHETIDGISNDHFAIDLNLSIESLPLSTRIAVPLGLIVNELTMNSLKYALKDHAGGELGLSLLRDADGIHMSIWDDGPGIDKNARVDSGLGQKLVQAFVQQLDGEMHCDTGLSGTRYRLRFPGDAPNTATLCQG